MNRDIVRQQKPPSRATRADGDSSTMPEPDDGTEQRGGAAREPETVPVVADRDECVSAYEAKKKTKYLKKGQLRFTDDDTSGDFIYIPSDCDWRTDESFASILAALQLNPPQIVIPFGTNDSVTDPTVQEDLRRGPTVSSSDRVYDVAEMNISQERVRNVIAGVSQACSEADSACFLIQEPYTGNKLATLACKAAANKKVPTIGLFSADDFSVVVPPGDNNPSSLRKNISADIFNGKKQEETQKQEEHVCVELRHDIKKAVRITCGFTPEERARGKLRIRNGLANMCSHRIVFCDTRTKEEFSEAFLKLFPAAFLAVGPDMQTFNMAMSCLRLGRPLVVLKNTGPAADAAAAVVQFGQGYHYYKTTDKKASEMKEMDNVTIEYINATFEEHLKKPRRYYRDGYDGIEEPSVLDALDGYPATQKPWMDAMTAASTFSSLAPNFKPEANVVLDVKKPLNTEDIQDELTEILSTIFDTLPELGGRAKDVKVLKRSRLLYKLLQSVMRRFTLESLILQLLIRTILLSTTVLAILASTDKEDDEDRDNTVAFDGGLDDSLKLANIILPIMGAIFIAWDSSFQPSFKYARLLLASKRIESEQWKFRTRTGYYRPRGRSVQQLVRVRERFAAECQDAFKECMGSDMAESSLTNFSHSLNLEEMPWTTGQENQRVPEPIKRAWKLLRWSDSEDPDEEKKHRLEDIMKKIEDGTYKTDADMIKGRRATEVEEVLKAGDYIERRLKVELRALQALMPSRALARRTLKVLFITITISSSALATFDFQEWIPLALAAAVACEFFLSYFQLETRVPALNKAATELLNTLFWWDGLTLVQTRSTKNRDMLVLRVETAIVAQYEQLAKETITLAKKRYNLPEDDEESENNATRRPVTPLIEDALASVSTDHHDV